MCPPGPLFYLFSVFSYTQILQITMFPDVSGIGTRIVRVEGKHADVLTTTTANKSVHCYICLIKTLTKAYLLKHISERSGDNNFCKGVKIIHFSSEIIFGQLL